ncbi:DUF3137 domain-containing protein [Geomonas subterranea]|uniref:DUF3137 domain-containing protein n=1 Tax=Geomonas subterranea TaxID=2847989 RepID=UPI001CD3F219|nr:DUF3137 domain-containing protein [Geomonas fuzhouensis]
MTDVTSLHLQLSGLLETLERERLERVCQVKKWLLVLAGVAGIAAIVAFHQYGTWSYGVFAGIAALLVVLVIASHQKGRFVGRFKVLVMPEMVRALGEELQYRSADYLDLSEFAECGLFMAPDRYTGSDLVEGYVGVTHVRFSLVHAEEEYTVTETVTGTDSDGHTTTRTETRTEYRTIFCGLLFSADCNKSFNGRTLITAGGSGFLSRMRSSHVALEDPRFSENFTVYGSDQVEARYLLTPSLMERIVELRSKVGKGLQLSFVNDRVYLALPMGLNAFRPSLWRRIDDIGSFAGYYGTLAFMIGLVDELSLNTRIWSKQA